MAKSILHLQEILVVAQDSGAGNLLRSSVGSQQIEAVADLLGLDHLGPAAPWQLTVWVHGIVKVFMGFEPLQRAPHLASQFLRVHLFSSRSFSRCTEFHKKPTATCCRLKKPKKAALNQGIFLPHLDNPGVSGHLRGGNAQNHLIFRGFPRCQKVATPYSFGASEGDRLRPKWRHSYFRQVFTLDPYFESSP